ncbi:hypothetical protein B0T16DRAFT_408639 [Cercophora newfieldiana]|uniref:Fe2OG dioxygenase domain-containing protein n=1 Tax=Cercophora newfieldiana TaxID=92897 RepID=A0AA39Y9U1_9PEZI|nr:hypothetical protein B0T16DRAFT_408639 [Cercophora newfieldiana]
MEPEQEGLPSSTSVILDGRMLALFKEVRSSVAEKSLEFTFACGGAIPIQRPSSQQVDPEPATAFSIPRTLPHSQFRSPPVQLRWDPNDASTPSSRAKITFPLGPSTGGNLEQLLEDMQPATFGRAGVDVYDEAYRKATKLDPERFSSNFNPYELGIVDTIAQTLLPSLRQAKQTRAVKAELYKLNVYSGPSGKFKSHVDTPRSPSQFGSLVVCLPLEHTGGALQVRHQGRTVTFDWSGSDQQAIRWAAFYSDCEHEVLEVSEGHRVTLTYNLYCVRGNGQLGGSCPTLDPKQLPMYETIREIVFDKSWGENGYIGYHCSHTYPHTTQTTLTFLPPDNLKGADMLMYEIFRSCGLKVLFRPSIEDPQYSAREDRELLEPWEMRENASPALGRSRKFDMWEYEVSGGISGTEEWDEWTGKEKMEQLSFDGDKPTPYRVSQHSRFINGEQVYWLNKRGHEEPQVSWISYGNQASAQMMYSSLTLVAVVPKGGAGNATDIGLDEAEEPEGVWQQTKVVSYHWNGEKQTFDEKVLLEGPSSWPPSSSETPGQGS